VITDSYLLLGVKSKAFVLDFVL